MDMVVILAFLALILSLTTFTLVQVLSVTRTISKLCGQYETHLKGCDERFKAAEGRLDKAGL